MPHIDIERLVLNYSYHIIFCTLFSITAATRIYMSNNSLTSVMKLKLNLNSSLRYKFMMKRQASYSTIKKNLS